MKEKDRDAQREEKRKKRKGGETYCISHLNAGRRIVSAQLKLIRQQ